jgi:hypothetical protein
VPPAMLGRASIFAFFLVSIAVFPMFGSGLYLTLPQAVIVVLLGFQACREASTEGNFSLVVALPPTYRSPIPFRHKAFLWGGSLRPPPITLMGPISFPDVAKIGGFRDNVPTPLSQTIPKYKKVLRLFPFRTFFNPHPLHKAKGRQKADSGAPKAPTEFHFAN